MVRVTVWSAGRNDAVAGATWRAIVWGATDHTVDGGGENTRGKRIRSPGVGEWVPGWVAVGRADALLAFGLVVLLLVRSRGLAGSLGMHRVLGEYGYYLLLPAQAGSLQACSYPVG